MTTCGEPDERDEPEAPIAGELLMPNSLLSGHRRIHLRRKLSLRSLSPHNGVRGPLVLKGGALG
jgi:hypothetical protein